MLIRQALTHLRQWFLEDSQLAKGGKPKNKSESSKTSDESSKTDAVVMWQQADVTIARWFADQLGYTQMVETLRGLRDLKLEPSTAVWSLPEGGTKQSDKSSTESSVTKSSILPRLEDVAREQILNHIRRLVGGTLRFHILVIQLFDGIYLFPCRLLDQHPECIDEVQECIQTLQSARPISPATVIDRHNSESSVESDPKP